MDTLDHERCHLAKSMTDLRTPREDFLPYWNLFLTLEKRFNVRSLTGRKDFGDERLMWKEPAPDTVHNELMPILDNWEKKGRVAMSPSRVHGDSDTEYLQVQRVVQWGTPKGQSSRCCYIMIVCNCTCNFQA